MSSKARKAREVDRGGSLGPTQRAASALGLNVSPRAESMHTPCRGGAAGATEADQGSGEEAEEEEEEEEEEAEVDEEGDGNLQVRPENPTRGRATSVVGTGTGDVPSGPPQGRSPFSAVLATTPPSVAKPLERHRSRSRGSVKSGGAGGGCNTVVDLEMDELKIDGSKMEGEELMQVGKEDAHHPHVGHRQKKEGGA